MKTHTKQNRATFFILALTLFAAPAFAGSATWNLNPGSSDWNTASNWTPATVPTFSSDTATFDLSHTTSVVVTNINSHTEVGSIVFTANAATNPFTITRTPGGDNALFISGTGVVNNSGVSQFFVNATGLNANGFNEFGRIAFLNSATAGSNTVFTNNGASLSLGVGARISFSDTSTAGSATITNNASSASDPDFFNGGAVTIFVSSSTAGSATINNSGSAFNSTASLSGWTSFSDTSTAGNSTINNDAGSVSGAKGGFAVFGANTSADTATAGNATINNNGASVSGAGSGATFFSFMTSAGSATINNNAATMNGSFGGQTQFRDTSSGGSAAINNNGASVGGTFDSLTQFYDNSTGGSANINNNGASAANAASGETSFHNLSNAGFATINNNAGTVSNASGGDTQFNDNSNAGIATINNNGAAIGHAGFTQFNGNSDAGIATINNKGGTTFQAAGGFTDFLSSSNAFGATINNNAGTANGAFGGFTHFFANSDAAIATINNNGASGQGPNGGQTDFYDGSSAASAEITSNGGVGLLSAGGTTIFHDSSDAGSATLIANSGSAQPRLVGIGFGGQILFNDNSTGGTSRVEVFGNGIVDISQHSLPGVTIGSVEGSGNVFLGSNNLSVGSNNLDTTFSGVIHDGAFGGGGGTGGSLAKIGTGMLNLSGTNTYTGATVVNAGKLIVDGSIASSSGVTVNTGATLGGHGNVSSISGAGAIAPGNSPGILTATHLDPSSGMSFVFELTQIGSPTYSNAAASGNDVLRLTDNSMPFTMSLTSSNQITIDFSGASLKAGQLYRGGFFTDTATATSLVSGATFLYTGTGGFTVNFDGFVTESIAAFASAPVINGTVLEFDISGEGNGGGPTVPDTAPTLALLLLSLSATFGLNSLLPRRSAAEVNHAN